MTVIDRDGKAGILVPLKNTIVSADIAGISARVTVVQTFENPSRTPIEAVYTFPLPGDAAVDRMRMNVAGRLVVGQIKKRGEARVIYENAKAAGQVASLLDQERPNMFTQSVANILPGARVEVEISYVQTLKYESGAYEFTFPMVVGPRYLPASTTDPEKVSPPHVNKDMRTGASVSMSVHVDAGAPVETVQSVLHDIDLRKEGTNGAYVSLKRKDEIPNRDFILRYRLKNGNTVKEQLVTHSEPDGSGTFCLVLNPPVTVQRDQVRPREVVFVMDQSGSQNGFPIEKSKDLTIALMDTLRPNDTFNVISFSNGAKQLWAEPRGNTAANLSEAKSYVRALQANGGTEFLPAIEMSLSKPPPVGRMRLVVFNTDGFVGNEFEILDRIQKYRQNARMFTFGIGNGVNQFLIDAMSVEGRGGSETVTLADQADKAVAKFINRTHSPILTDVGVKFEGVQVSDVSPSAVPDVFAGQPVIVTGRFTKPGKGKVVLSGLMGSDSWSREVPVEFGAQGTGGAGVTSLWARRRIEDLSRANWLDQLRGKPSENQTAITDLALKYGIMTQFTSFVAVEQKIVNVGGKQRTVNVPLEMTDGVNMAGDADEKLALKRTGSVSGLQGGATLGVKPGTSAGKSKGQRGGNGGGGGFSGGASPTLPGSPSSVGTAVFGDNSFIVQGSEEALKELDRRIGTGEIKATVKVDKKLLDVKSGSVEVQVWTTSVSKELLEKLKKAGLKVEDSDGKLKVVFGSVDVKNLEALAKVVGVIRIKPLDEDR